VSFALLLSDNPKLTGHSSHHALTLACGDKLYLAPLDENKVQKVIDIGTGTGWFTKCSYVVPMKLKFIPQVSGLCEHRILW
jgi:hypothetical protein